MIFVRWKKWIFSICGAAAMAVLALVGMGHKYALPPQEIATTIVRQGVLTAIAAGVEIYDPSVVKPVRLGPPGEEGKGGDRAGNFVRLEEFLKQTGSPQGIRILELRNERVVTGRFPFLYQPHDEPRLAELRKRHNFDSVVASAQSELEAMVLLRNWARSQFRRKDYQPLMEVFDALKILESNVRNTRGERHQVHQYRPCHFFPMFYSQILLSMGHQSRLVRISNPEERGYNGHGMTEVWSNQFKKWIIMDPDLNLYYEKDGIPLNLMEVHKERYENAPSRVKIMRGMQTAGDQAEGKEVRLEEMVKYHSYFQIVDMRNDWMTNHYFRGHPLRSDRASLFWLDGNLPPAFHFKQETNQFEDFYWTLNQAEIRAKKENSGEEMTLAFKSVTPNFSHFEILLDGSQRIEWKNGFYTWKTHPGMNSFSIRPVNQFGIRGIQSFVKIER